MSGEIQFKALHVCMCSLPNLDGPLSGVVPSEGTLLAYNGFCDVRCDVACALLPLLFNYSASVFTIKKLYKIHVSRTSMITHSFIHSYYRLSH